MNYFIIVFKLRGAQLGSGKISTVHDQRQQRSSCTGPIFVLTLILLTATIVVFNLFY